MSGRWHEVTATNGTLGIIPEGTGRARRVTPRVARKAARASGVVNPGLETPLVGVRLNAKGRSIFAASARSNKEMVAYRTKMAEDHKAYKAWKDQASKSVA